MPSNPPLRSRLDSPQLAPEPRPGYRLRSLALGLVLFVPLALTGLGSAPASGQELYNFTASVMGTIGGALDVAGEDPGLGQTGFQLGFAWLTQPKTQVGVRLGQVSMDGEQLDGLFDPELQYATIGGEYFYQEAYYKSGLFLGLGLYSLEGIALGETADDSSLGLNLGVSGEFPINPRFSVLAELSMHYADLQYAQLFAFGHVGLAFHF